MLKDERNAPIPAIFKHETSKAGLATMFSRPLHTGQCPPNPVRWVVAQPKDHGLQPFFTDITTARAGKSRQEQYIGSHPNLERASIQRTGNTRALQTARITRSREKQMSPADRRLKMTWPRTVARCSRISETRQQGLRSAERSLYSALNLGETVYNNGYLISRGKGRPKN